MVAIMKIEIENITCINDGQEVNKNFVDYWGILDYCNHYNGKIFISFVGIVILRDKFLFSFPKHYNISKDEVIDKMKKILELLTVIKATYGSFDKGEKNEFPLRGYLDVLAYYKKYNLYTKELKYTDKGYSGKINWKKTIRESNKIMTTNGILFTPFVLNKRKNENVFLSRCMDFVLTDASQNYGELIKPIIRYRTIFNSKKTREFTTIVKELYKIKNNYFKDSEKRLISGLIKYFEWKSAPKKGFKLLTLKFENYWEYMVNIYLNHNFAGYEEERILWKLGSDRKIFTKPKKEYIETKEVLKNKFDNHFQIQFDHLFISEDDYVYIFDSKYFNKEASELNYKQMVYHYILKDRYPDKVIINGLLLPTEKEYYTKVHIDRKGLDGVKIVEHYLNFSKVLNVVLFKLNTFF